MQARTKAAPDRTNPRALPLGASHRFGAALFAAVLWATVSVRCGAATLALSVGGAQLRCTWSLQPLVQVLSPTAQLALHATVCTGSVGQGSAIVPPDPSVALVIDDAPGGGLICQIVAPNPTYTDTGALEVSAAGCWADRVFGARF